MSRGGGQGCLATPQSGASCAVRCRMPTAGRPPRSTPAAPPVAPATAPPHPENQEEFINGTAGIDEACAPAATKSITRLASWWEGAHHIPGGQCVQMGSNHGQAHRGNSCIVNVDKRKERRVLLICQSNQGNSLWQAGQCTLE